MRALWLVVALGAVAEAREVARLPIIPPFERNCLAPESWEQEQTCIDTHEKGAKVSTMSSELKQVTTVGGQHYLFVRFADRWRMVYRPGDANYELASAGEIKLANQPARRLELSHHVPLGNAGVLFERVTMVCPLAGSTCQVYVTACTVITRGRATETFRGELAETAQGLVLVGDRTHSRQTCRDR